MIKILSSIIFILYCSIGHSMAYIVNSQDKDKILPKEIRSGYFDSIDIICIPSRIESAMQIDQKILENSYFYKISIQQIKLTPYWSTLIKALNDTQIKRVDELKELRCAIIFYDKKTKVMAMYFDKEGNYGAVNSIPVIFKEGVYDWMNNNFSKIMK